MNQYSTRLTGRLIASTIAFLLLLPVWLPAEVTREEIATRRDVRDGKPFGAAGAYEYMTGRIFFSVDPASSSNRIITGLDKAAKNSAGRVEFSADLGILRPKDLSRGNGFTIVDVPNRGGVYALRFFNMGVNRIGPAASMESLTEAELGDGFLLREGYTIVWVGWEFDVPDGRGLQIDLPRAIGVTGVVRGALTPNAPGNNAVFAELGGYSPKDAAAAGNTLTVRNRLSDAPVVIPRGKWRLSGNRVNLDGGFEPGRTYELSFATTDPPLGGLGFAAVRDTASWVKYKPGALAPSRFTLAYGISQTGRFLRDFLYLGFNTDENNRPVFDGVMNQIAGASRTNFNQLWSTPISQPFYAATSFPFADGRQRDPVTGAEEGATENSRSGKQQPKIFNVNTDVEYWGGGRVAALLHTTSDGNRDTALPDNTRAYLFAGTQHAPAHFPAALGNGQQKDNPNDYRWSMRALLVAMRQWMSDGIVPPVSQYPRIQDRTLVQAQDVAFPNIPGVLSPAALKAGKRVANPLIPENGAPGTPLPLLVPQVDSDGNDLAGIRLPDTAVPLATYTGWNFRSVGTPDQLVPLVGAYIPFTLSKAEREQKHDPRLSIEERYSTREAYLLKVEQAAMALAKQRYLLAEDVPALVKHAAEHWDVLVGFAPIDAAEIISFRPSTLRAGSFQIGLRPEGGYRATNAPLLQLVMDAYNLQQLNQITGQPDWFSTAKYDIEIKVDNSLSPQQQADRWRSVLQTLLADKFKFSAHRESREVAIYDLVAAKSGPGLKPASAGDCVSTMTNPCNGFMGTNVSIAGQQVSMDQLASRLSRSLGQTVVNKTGLPGVFDVLIEWTIQQSYSTPVVVGVFPPKGAGLSIFTALEEQLGLTLQPQKGQVEILIIDLAEGPPQCEP